MASVKVPANVELRDRLAFGLTAKQLAILAAAAVSAYGSFLLLAPRHGRYYLARLEEIDPVLRGPRTGEFLAWYAVEEDNLRAMLDRLSDQAPAEAARATHLLRSYWTARGTLDEGRERVHAFLASDQVDGVTRASLLGLLSDLEERVGHLDAAQGAAEEALTLATAADARAVLVDALVALAWIANRRDEADEAIQLASRALQEAAGLDERQRLICLNALGSALTRAERDDEARAVHRELAAAYRLLGDAVNEAISLANLGNIDSRAGNYDAARSVYARAVELDRQLDTEETVVPNATLGLGIALLGLGQHSEARAIFAGYLARAVNDDLTPDSALKPWLGLALSGIALTSGPEAFAQAARLRGAVIKLRQQGELIHSIHDEEFANRFEQPLITTLGEKAWAREQAAGTAMSLEEAIALARSLTEREPRTPNSEIDSGQGTVAT